MKLFAKVVLSAGLLVAGASLALAHHGSRISYDMNQMVTVKGVITEFDWTNPHVYFLFDVKETSGKVVSWAAETDPPSTMTRYGWNKNYLKVGDLVEVTVWPSKVGAPRGFMAKLVKSDGTITDHTNALPPE